MQAEQAVTGLAFGILCLRRAGMACLARLAWPKILHDLRMDRCDVRIWEILVTRLAGAHRVRLQVSSGGNPVPTVAVHTMGQVGFILSLKVPRIM